MRFPARTDIKTNIQEQIPECKKGEAREKQIEKPGYPESPSGLDCT